LPPPQGRIQGQLMPSPAQPFEHRRGPAMRPIPGRIQVLDGQRNIVALVAPAEAAAAVVAHSRRSSDLRTQCWRVAK
jgi:hypothetical protein